MQHPPPPCLAKSKTQLPNHKVGRSISGCNPWGQSAPFYILNFKYQILLTVMLKKFATRIQTVTGMSTRMVIRSARHRLRTAQLILEILRLLVFQMVHITQTLKMLPKRKPILQTETQKASPKWLICRYLILSTMLVSR